GGSTSAQEGSSSAISLQKSSDPLQLIRPSSSLRHACCRFPKYPVRTNRPTQQRNFALASRVVSLLTGPGLIVLPISIDKENLVLLKHHLEASEGLGYIVAKRGGNVLLVSHESRQEEFNVFLRDLKLEL